MRRAFTLVELLVVVVVIVTLMAIALPIWQRWLAIDVQVTYDQPHAAARKLPFGILRRIRKLSAGRLARQPRLHSQGRRPRHTAGKPP
ncbi:MAG: prepilin-type N-terminal cleavage/methylation domain-containing protein [Kiritimatiellae bacterium]|nr:prepilin-type N-terminal cleavage/methylation domain-containing protein [Kiritimatiellia bacterium]